MIWDEAASVWVAESDQLPGLITRSPTFEALHLDLPDMIADQLLLSGAAGAGADVPYLIRAERRDIVRVPLQ